MPIIVKINSSLSCKCDSMGFLLKLKVCLNSMHDSMSHKLVVSLNNVSVVTNHRVMFNYMHAYM